MHNYSIQITPGYPQNQLQMTSGYLGETGNNFNSVVVITLRSHRRGPQFEPGLEHFVLFYIGSSCYFAVSNCRKVDQRSIDQYASDFGPCSAALDLESR